MMLYFKRDKLLHFSYSAMPRQQPRLTPKGVLTRSKLNALIYPE